MTQTDAGRPLRVLLFIHSLHGGGAERVAADLSAHWAGMGRDVMVVTQAGVEGDVYALHPKVRREVPDDVLVLPAHNEPFQPLHARLEHLERGHQRGLERLQELLGEGPKRAIDLFGALFARRIDQDLLALATGECLANLNYLVQRGRVTASEDGQGVAWYSLA